MSFFDMPAWESPSGYRIPAWLRPPEAMVPGIVPVELLLGRTDTDAVLVTHLRAYPTGLEFILTVRPHPDQLQQRGHDPDRPHRFLYRDLRLELRFADGQRASTHPRSWPRTFETEQPNPPFLYYHGSGGSERGWHSTHWLWGLPPPGPLTFVCQWPASQLPASGVEIDASLILEAADRAVLSGRPAEADQADSLSGGDRVMVTGRLRQRSWETPEGDKRSSTRSRPMRSAPPSSGPRPRSSGPANAATATAPKGGSGRPNAAALQRRTPILSSSTLAPRLQPGALPS